MRQKKVFIFTIGCEKRFIDAKRVMEYFKKNKWKIAKTPMRCDLIFFNTCAVNKHAEDACIKKIIKFKKLNADLIIAGCLPSINKERLKKYFNGLTLSPHSLDKIDKIFPNHQVKFSQIPDANEFYGVDWLREGLLEKFKNFLIKNEKISYIRISNGCLGKCSYCGIRRAVGRLKSKPLRDCLKELDLGLKSGVRKFIIEGDDVGAYGLDIGLNFPYLMKRMISKEGKFKLYITNFNPKWLLIYEKDLLNIFRSSKIGKIELCMQSGSEKILRLMNRYVPVRKVEEILKKIKAENPNLKLRIHIMVGFPKESEDDFTETLKFIEEVPLSELYVFKFHRVPNTIAAKLRPLVPEEIVQKRIKAIKNIAKAKNIKLVLDERAHERLFIDRIEKY
jgi:MiaB/RimO family radical SAM methylthiotransferase